MLSAGVTEAVLKFLKSEMPPVQFKLLGTLRMLIDAQEAAEQLGKNVKLVERLVEWCEAKDHAGVMGESNRLLSALIRHSKSKVSSRENHSLKNIQMAFLETPYHRSYIISLHFTHLCINTLQIDLRDS